MSPKNISNNRPHKNPIKIPSFSPRIKPKDAVKTINRFGTIPANARLRKTVLCSIKQNIIKIKTQNFLNKVLTPVLL